MARRIESKTSKTAEFTCMMRCMSYLEKREHLKSDDNISLVIMNAFIKLLIQIPLTKKYFFSIFPHGMYEYVIARTKYIDDAVKNALKGGTDQILILGAGFDSRGIRFGDRLGKTKIYELDASATQNAKIERYNEKGVHLPDKLIYIPIDFDKQSIAERLTECGFEKGRKSLFIMEGLTMYLQPESVDSLFKIIRDFAGPGSAVVFDFIYASVLRQENLYQGEKELFDSVSKNGESFYFGIEKGAVGDFLAQYGFEAAEVMDTDRIQKTYYTDESACLLSNVNGTHCLVTAVEND